MAAYGTATYDYTKGTNDLARNKGVSDASQAYGRFLGQERFRRDQGDMTQNFKRQMPKVGSAFNARGLHSSGLRQQAQTQTAEQYNQQLQRSQFDQAQGEQGFEMRQAADDAGYQAALADLFARFQMARGNVDPFSQVVV